MQPPPTLLPSSLWVSAAAPHPGPVTSSRAELAELCHLSTTAFILLFPSLFAIFIFFLYYPYISTSARCTHHINPHGHNKPHFVFMSCCLLSHFISPSLPPSFALSFVLFAPISPRFRSPGSNKSLMKKRGRDNNHSKSLK